MLGELKSRLKGKVAILGVGNTLRGDDGLGSILASRIKEKVPFIVFDAGVSPENYLEKVVKERPDTIVIIDAADFKGSPGELRILGPEGLKNANLFSTHNASLSLTINYLQNNLSADIIILIIQPKNINFGDKLNPEISKSLTKLENWFYDAFQKQK